MSKTMQGLVIPPAAGTVWEIERGRPATFKLDSEDTDGKVSVFEEIVPPGSGTPIHAHTTGDEVIHIISGDFIVRMNDETHRAPAGSWVFIPRGLSHAWRNCGTEAGRAFFIFTPGSGGKFFEEMREHKLPLPEIEPKVSGEVLARHGYEDTGIWDWS
jgi:quercetin dioxygenase-like cupin family protein